MSKTLYMRDAAEQVALGFIERVKSTLRGSLAVRLLTDAMNSTFRTCAPDS
jgi:hypothetical protein